MRLVTVGLALAEVLEATDGAAVIVCEDVGDDVEAGPPDPQAQIISRPPVANVTRMPSFMFPPSELHASLSAPL
jgi:hypothetical protein